MKTQLRQAISTIRQNPFQLAISVLADTLTLFLLVFVWDRFGEIIIAPVTDLLMPEQQAGAALQLIILYTITFWIILYMIYTCFQAISWHVAAKASHIHFSIKRFFLINLIWFALFAVINTFHDITLVINRLARQSVINERFFTYAVLVIYFLLGYVALVSYFREKPWKEALEKRKRLFPAYLAFLGIIAAGYFVTILANFVHFYLNVIVGFAVFLPAVMLARVYLVSVWMK